MNNKGPECRVMLCRCLAIVIRKEGSQGDPGDFWMYESGYLLFQGLITANSVCWWSGALQGATKTLVYRGYISPGAILVSSEPCSLEILRGAWARRVLQPPSGYQIVGIEDIEECIVSSVPQTQWTPLPEAVCAVVLRLSSQGRPAGTESIREALILAFPHVSPPSEGVLYDTLAQLTAERKLYHTSKGYFIVTPERRRSRSHSRGRRKHDDGSNKALLMSNEEALVLVHGEMATIRDGEVTHQCIQTNLADVICGGNASDKILYARINKRRSASFPAHRSPERRGSFRLWGSSRRLRRSASTKTLAKHCTDSSSSTDYPVSDSATPTKKASLLSRLFRRSKRSQCQINTFSAQFPPMEWFNSKAVHLHCVATQTSTSDKDSAISLPVPYYFDNSELGSTRSATLPRRHRRQLSTDSTYVTSYVESRDQSPSLRRCSPLNVSNTLPRKSNNRKSPFNSTKSYSSSRKTSRSSLSPKVGISNNDIQCDSATRSNENSPLREIIRTSERNAIKTSSLESLKPSHAIINNNNNSELKMKCEPVNESNGAINRTSNQDSTLSFKSSVALDNSGPSSIESHKSSKTGSSITSGPSSLESHKTVISRPSPSNSSTNSEQKLTKKPTHKKKETTKHKTVSKSKSNESSENSKIIHSNSFTLQVTRNQTGTNLSNNTNNAVTTTINGGSTANTKIYVQNSPVRSVITFENGQNDDSNPNVVIINGTDAVQEQNKYHNIVSSDNVEYAKNTNSIHGKHENSSLNNSPIDQNQRIINETMNNGKKLSLSLTAKENLNYRNLLKNQNQHNLESPEIQNFEGFTRNSFCSSLPSPTKSYDSICSSFGKYLSDSKTSLDKQFAMANSNNTIEKNILGSEPNICYKEQEYIGKTLSNEKTCQQQFPSLSDLSFNFTSLAAQKILKGVSINSIDTLVELNTAAGEKQNNCDVVHTDFGLV